MDWEFGIEESLGTGLPLAFVLFMAPTVAFTAHRRCAGGQGGQPEGDVPKHGMNFPPHYGLPAGALWCKGHLYRPIALGYQPGKGKGLFTTHENKAGVSRL